MAEADDRHAALRTKILSESIETSNEPRWGYFGVPGSLAIGDNSYAPRATRKPPAEDDAGAEPVRNIQAATLKKGAGPDVYFQFETPLALGDPYVDPSFLMKKGKVQMLDPEAAFKPPGKVKVGTNKLGYPYVEHMDTAKDPKEVKEKYKDFMPPRQILTNPGKKGGGGVLTQGVLFGWGEERKFPESIPDDYDAARKQRRKELEEHKAKVQELPFKGIDYGNKNFATNTDSYHYDIPTHIPRDPEKGGKKWKDVHEAAFKPSNPMKKGAVGALMGEPPAWLPDPPEEKTRQPKKEDERPGFKLNAPRSVFHPTPSVVTLSRNMRNERPTSFMRPCL